MSGFSAYEDVFDAHIRMSIVLIHLVLARVPGGFRSRPTTPLFSAGLAVAPLYTLFIAVNTMKIRAGPHVTGGLFPGRAYTGEQKGSD